LLESYRKKRDFHSTPEPRGKTDSGKEENALVFVIQKHAARRLHYDFRLELDGVLLSWAVPKGLPLNPSDKRMAVRTEDHPIEYREFEGIIPSGYGAGKVIIWDRGTYTAYKDGRTYSDDRAKAEAYLRRCLREGKISFFLEGEKLKGAWSLVRMKGKESNWLLIKHNDGFTEQLENSINEESVVSGRTLNDISPAKNPSPSSKSKTTAQEPHGAQALFPKFAPPMLATLADAPFVEEGWFFEPKLDGIRGLAYIHSGKVALYSRNGLSLGSRYPRLIKELSLQNQDIVLDGEIVALDASGRASFQTLQSRSGLTKTRDIHEAEINTPVVYYVFDVLYYRGQDLRAASLTKRKAILQSALITTKQVQSVENLGNNGYVAFEACAQNGLEGIVGKRADSHYQSGHRSRAWLKVKAVSSDEFVICGYTEGTGARKRTFGALILGEHDQHGQLTCVGSVGTGFNEKVLHELLARMEPIKASQCPFSQPPPGKLRPVWLKPKLVAEVKFAERTKDRILRSPVFMRLRDDKLPEQVQPSIVVHVASTRRSVRNEKSRTKH
jgi:bifunctional non-homologous end joining protein LigD